MSSVRSDDQVELDGKYIVFPRENERAALPSRSFFVLRDSDQFAHAVLYSYVALIQTMLEQAADRPGFLTEEEIKRLRAIEEYVSNLAEEWQRAGDGRLPD